MFGFIKKKFLYRFIYVEIQDNLVTVNIYDIKNSNLLSQSSEDFVLESKDSFTDELINYINTKQEELSRSYVVTLLNSQGQGIIPTCSATKFKDYSVDRRYIYNICVDNLFTNFVSKIEINWLQKTFAKTGIDFIFSPFVILKDLVEKEEVSTEVLLYILYYNQNVTLVIKQGNKYIYGDFFNTRIADENPLYSDYDNEDEESDEDEFEIEDEYEFEDEDDEINLEEDGEDLNIKEVELIEENKGFAKHLSSSLKEFYSNKRYESNFIDRVKIFSENEVDNSVLTYMEDELLLSTTVDYINMDEEIIKLCKKEVFSV